MYTPKEFYIADITDGRADKHSIGHLALIGAQPGETSINFKGGITAVKNLVDNSLTKNKTLRPVTINITNLKVTETALTGGKVSGRVVLTVSYNLRQGEDLVHLTDYTGNATYQRTAGPAQQIEPLVRSTINNSLIYLNNWMNAEAGHNIKLAKAVKIFFSNYSEPLEGDTIYYHTNRPLKWTDFQRKPKLTGNHGAEIFASLGYAESVEVINGIVQVKIALKVYAPKSACWVRDDVKDAYGLNHEQRHFDIVKLVAEHFKKAILAENLTVANYDGPINMAYFDALREIDKLQKQYDGETNHSINSYQQQLWADKIDKELQQLGIKPTGV
ncbi:hypothetical protein [Mucilaginibacter sp.]|uniref:hypothetical protein n=1 Tax=Mucilaginibacter sp. TaxID=1882438 RepID=UPI0035BBE1BA